MMCWKRSVADNVKQFTILQSMDNGWRTLLNLSLFGVLSSALLWLVAVVRGDF